MPLGLALEIKDISDLPAGFSKQEDAIFDILQFQRSCCSCELLLLFLFVCLVVVFVFVFVVVVFCKEEHNYWYVLHHDSSTEACPEDGKSASDQRYQGRLHPPPQCQPPQNKGSNSIL